MITVVSDASPVNCLVLIGAVDVLPKLFQEILIPPAVFAELQHPQTPKLVFNWSSKPPSWRKIQQPVRIDRTVGLGAGETEAISLPIELQASSILMDERRGRIEAKKRGLLPVGLLSILDAADARDLLNLEDAAHKLRQTNFRINPAMIEALLQRARLRKRD